MEGDGLGLDLALLHVDLVAGEDDGDVLANTDQVTYAVLVEFSMRLDVAETYGASWGRSCM